MNSTFQHETIDAPTDLAQPEASKVNTISPALPVDRIVLIGFMGAGKSTIGRLLAEQLGWQFIDIDTEVETKAGRTVAEIFRHEGEFVFRHLESSAIARGLGLRKAVVALGGGAPEVLTNRLLLEQTPRTAVVWLEAPFDELVTRCTQQDGAERPVLADHATAQERFTYRAPLYRRCAKIRITTSGKGPSETLAEVLENLG